MPPLQKLIGAVGLSKQSAKGNPAASPATFGFGIRSGKVFNVPVNQAYDAQTLLGAASDRFAPAVNRTEMNPGAAFKSRLWSRSGGLALYAALGTIADAGGAPPYTHTITPAMDLPYLTLFGRLATEYAKLQDVKVDQLVLSWDGRSPAELDYSLLGLVPSFGTGAWTITNDETTQTFMGPNAGVFQLDAGDGVLAVAAVRAATITIANNLEVVDLSKSVFPDDLVPAGQTIEGVITLKPNDLGEWRKIMTGAAGGVVAQQTPVYGSFSLKLVQDANTDLLLVSNRAAFMADFPDADPGGGSAELALAFSVVRPTDGSAAFTATIRNVIASY